MFYCQNVKQVMGPMLHNLFCFLIFLSFYLCNDIHRFPESIISAARSDSLLSIHLPDTLTALSLTLQQFPYKNTSGTKPQQALPSENLIPPVRRSLHCSRLYAPL